MDERGVSVKSTESNPPLVTHSTVEWVDGDPTWSRAYATIRWVTLVLASLLVPLLTLNILWAAGAVTSLPAVFLFFRVPYGLLLEWVWLGPMFALVFAGGVLLTRKAVYKVAPTDRGLALQVLPFWTRVIPWMDVRWWGPTRLELKRGYGPDRATVTWEQYERIYRWFHPSQ